jgi:tetratricopeptide (TPR) repeat protein
MDHVENLTTPPALKHALFLLIVTVLVYAQSLIFPFLLFDDTPFIVQNPSVHGWSSTPSFFFPSAIPDPHQKKNLKIANFYRPAVGLWEVLNYEAFGLHPAGWRIAALALYALGVWLFWRVAHKLTRDDFTAIAAALLFALHPLHVEGIAWLSGSCVEVLLCTFFFGGFLAYLRWRETSRPLWLALCGVLVLFALLTKETGAALPLLILIHAFLFRRQGEQFQKPRWLILAIGIVVPVAIYTLLRVLAIHGAVISNARHTWGEVLRSVPLFFAVYLQHVVWPVHLANWYNIQIIPSITFTDFYLPLAFCLAYAAVTLWALARKPLISFLLLWWVVPLLPAFVGMINFVDTEYMHDRFTFEALGGLCILAAAGLRRLPATAQPLFGFRAASVAALALITALLGSLSALLAYTWHNDFAMAAHAVAVSPMAIRPRILLGSALQDRKDREGALALYRDTLRLDPNRWETLFAYGTALANDGDRTDAVRVLSHGLDVAPTKTAFYLILSDILTDAGRFDDASRILESGVSKAEEPDLLRAKLAIVQAQAQAFQHRAPVGNVQ